MIFLSEYQGAKVGIILLSFSRQSCMLCYRLLHIITHLSEQCEFYRNLLQLCKNSVV